MTSNRGLAGAFNANLIKEARTLVGAARGEGVQVDLHVVGRKGIGYFRYVGRALAVDAHRHRATSRRRRTPASWWTR